MRHTFLTPQRRASGAITIIGNAMTTQAQRKKWNDSKKQYRAARLKLGFKPITIECHVDDAAFLHDFAKTLKEVREKNKSQANH
jgi:hypothetical protein